MRREGGEARSDATGLDPFPRAQPPTAEAPRLEGLRGRGLEGVGGGGGGGGVLAPRSCFP